MDPLPAWRNNKKFRSKHITFNISFYLRHSLANIYNSGTSESDLDDEFEKFDRCLDLPLANLGGRSIGFFHSDSLKIGLAGC